MPDGGSGLFLLQFNREGGATRLAHYMLSKIIDNDIYHIFVVTRYREMSAGNALPVRLVLIRPVCVEEFWSAAAILRFTEEI